ncbi:unnamed protein product [Paramecium primaurelia]|uniref:Transmembrane protein n=1 Tax=Paramecium primaurelia TaxID=5886 RepID=A0A8S1PRG2_PARPR|nr:unnamed protein product [Paramecium primaurelia]
MYYMNFYNIICYFFSTIILLATKFLYQKFVLYNNYSTVLTLMKHFNHIIYLTGSQQEIEFCAISDTYKYFHPETMEEFIPQYSDSKPNIQTSIYYVPDQTIAYNKNICIFQKFAQISYYQLSDNCHIKQGINFDMPNIKFASFLFVASSDPLIVYFYNQLVVNDQYLMHISNVQNQLGNSQLDYKLRQFWIQVIESHNFPVNFKRSQLIQVDFQQYNGVLKVSQINNNVIHPQVLQHAYDMNKRMILSKYNNIRNLIKRKLKNFQMQESIFIALQELTKDKALVQKHDDSFQILIDYNRVGQRVYNYVESTCP